jgi:hypothetical protein
MFQSCYNLRWESLLESDLYAGKSRVKKAAITHSQAFDPIRPNDCASFVKIEVNSGAARKARLIQANVNEATAYENPREYYACLKALADFSEHEVIRAGVRFRLVYAGGRNHDDLSDLVSEWLSLKNICIDERDGKNWDASMQQPMMSAILELYSALGLSSASRAQARYPRTNGRVYANDGFGRTKMKYVSCWKRLSGDWDTTFGNTAISMMCCVFSISQLPAHLRPRLVHALFMGDDYWGVYQYESLPNLTDLRHALNHYDAIFGITPERAIFLDPLMTSFISLTLWPRHPGGYQFVPKPAKQMRKLFWSIRPHSPRHVLAVRNGICINFFPVYQGFEMMMRFIKFHFTPGVAAVKYQHFYADMFTMRGREVNWVEGFSRKYTIPFEATRFPFPVDEAVYYHPVIDLMLKQESADPIDRPGAY